MEGHRADGLCGKLGKDSVAPGRTTTQLGAVWTRLLQQNSKVNVSMQGEPLPLRGLVSGWCLGWADRQETWVLVPTLPLICCVTLGKPLPLSECQCVQGEA